MPNRLQSIWIACPPRKPRDHLVTMKTLTFCPVLEIAQHIFPPRGCAFSEEAIALHKFFNGFSVPANFVQITISYPMDNAWQRRKPRANVPLAQFWLPPVAAPY